MSLTVDEGEPALDTVAAVLSSLCLVHCLVLPLLMVAVPVAGQIASLSGLASLHGPDWLHWILIAVALPFSIWALRQGLRSHGNGGPWRLAAGGFVAMALGAFAHGHAPLEQMLTIAGGILVALAHWRNWRVRNA